MRPRLSQVTLLLCPRTPLAQVPNKRLGLSRLHAPLRWPPPERLLAPTLRPAAPPRPPTRAHPYARVQLRVQLGFGMPQDEIVPDRAFNTRSTTNAFLGWDAVASVQYDAREAPDRQTVEFARIGPDMRPLPPKRIELYLNNQ